VEYDEDQGYAVLELRPCAEEGCKILLCSCCDQFHCDGCGQAFCIEHRILIDSGPCCDPLACCAVCAREAEPLELAPPPIAPAREIETPKRKEAA